MVSYLLSLAEMRQIARLSESRAEPLRWLAFVGAANSSISLPEDRLVHNLTFLKRQALHLRPDPAQSGRAPIQAGDRAARTQPDGQDAREPHRRSGTGARSRRRRDRQLAEVLENFQGRHRNLLADLRGPRRRNGRCIGRRMPLSRRTQRQLVGAYFLHEYSFEAAALFNPSIVAHPDQSGVPEGSAALHPEPARRRRRTCVLPDIPIGAHCGRRHASPSTRRHAWPPSPHRAGRIIGRTGGDDIDVVFRAGRGHQRAGDLSGHRSRNRTGSRMPASSNSTRTAGRSSMRPTPPTAARRSDRS